MPMCLLLFLSLNALLLVLRSYHLSALRNNFLAKPVHYFFFTNQSLLFEIGDGFLLHQLRKGGSRPRERPNKTRRVKVACSFESSGGHTITGLNLSNMGDYTIEMSLSLEHSTVNGEGVVQIMDFLWYMYL